MPGLAPGTHTSTSAFMQDTHANRPAAASANNGQFYFETDTTTWFQSTGSTWIQLTPGVAAVAPTGGTGAASAIRLIGANSSGAPASGTWVAGDVAGDLTGKLWYCTAGGTPGTWGQIGGAGAVTQIGSVVTSGSAANITFSGIAGTYSTLMLSLICRSTRASNNTDILLAQVNSDTGSNYSDLAGFMYGGSAAAHTAETVDGTSAPLLSVPAATSASGDAASMTLWIPSYAAAVFNKSFHYVGFWPQADSTGSLVPYFGGGRWKSTAAITSIKLTLQNANFVDGSTAILYGLQ